MKQGVASALDRLTEFNPSLKFAVVFDTDRWHPVQPPPGSEWDYEPFVREDLAREALADPQQGMSECELWEHRDHQWQQVA